MGNSVYIKIPANAPKLDEELGTDILRGDTDERRTLLFMKLHEADEGIHAFPRDNGDA